MNLSRLHALCALAVCLSLLLQSAAGETANLTRIDPGLTSPTGYYRWMNVADQIYAASYRDSYSYDLATVQAAIETPSPVLRGVLVGTNLKPNFAYQLKLVASPDAPCNERIAKAGRYWEQTWSGTEWSSGWNLNNKGDGSYPSPNDLTYLARRDIADGTSPTGKLYRYTGYLLMDFFITDDNGNATLSFQADSSYHVLWSGSGIYSGAKIATFDPSTINPAYSTDYPPSTISIWGEWERLPLGGIFLDSGAYTCQMILTEESFHSYSTYGGIWAAAMGAQISFSILLPGDANRDCRVDIADLIFIRNRLNASVESGDNHQADVNGDGRINVLDLIHTRNRLGTACSQE